MIVGECVRDFAEKISIAGRFALWAQWKHGTEAFIGCSKWLYRQATGIVFFPHTVLGGFQAEAEETGGREKTPIWAHISQYAFSISVIWLQCLSVSPLISHFLSLLAGLYHHSLTLLVSFVLLPTSKDTLDLKSSAEGLVE